MKQTRIDSVFHFIFIVGITLGTTFCVQQLHTTVTALASGPTPVTRQQEPDPDPNAPFGEWIEQALRQTNDGMRDLIGAKNRLGDARSQVRLQSQIAVVNAYWKPTRRIPALMCERKYNTKGQPSETVETFVARCTWRNKDGSPKTVLANARSDLTKYRADVELLSAIAADAAQGEEQEIAIQLQAGVRQVKLGLALVDQAISQ